MIFLEYAILIAGFALAYYEVRLKDAYKASLQEIWTVPAEKNSLFRSDSGYYSEKKGWIVDGIVAAIFLTLAFVLPYPYAKLATGLILAGIAGAMHIKQDKDWKAFKKALARQKDILTLLKRDPEGDHVPMPRLVAFGQDNGKPRHVFASGSFYDFYVDTDIPEGQAQEWEQAKKAEALAVIKPRLVKLAQMNEKDWFDEKRATKV